MSNLLKSKLFFGVMLVAVLVLGGLAVNATPAAALECSINSTLRVGSVGVEVSCLQTTLGILADGKFGPMTNAAVRAWQASNGLVADGVFGPMSRAAWMAGTPVSGLPAGCTSTAGFSATTGQPCNVVPAGLPAGCTSTSGYSPVTGARCDSGSSLPAGCTSTAGYSPTTGAKCDSTTPAPGGALEGTAGLISTVTRLSQYNAEEVGAGQDDVKVLGFEVKATNDGDIEINSVKVSFAIANASGSRRLDSYADSVSVWQGSTKIGSSDAVEFNKDSTGNYSKTISVSNSVVRAGVTEKFYVAIDALNNLDSGDIDSEVMTIGLGSIRFTDGSGVVTTDSSTGILPLTGVSVNFVSFSVAANTELKISLNDTPLASVVKVSTTVDTKDVVLLKGKMKLQGSSDVLLESVPFTLVTVGGTSLDDVASSVTLKIGSNSYTETLGANCVPTCASNTTAVVTFDNLDYDIEAGDTVSFVVTADINDLEGVVFIEGDSLAASLTTTNRAAIVVENEEGDQLTDATEMTGSAVGEAQSFRSQGINISLVSTSAVKTPGLTTKPDIGTYTIAFDVTAFGGDMYIDGTKPTLTGTDSIDLDIIPGAGGTGTQDAVITSSTGATMSGTINTTSRFLVRDGETERFTITSVVTPTVAGGIYSVKLASLPFGNTDADITDATVTTGTAAWEYTTNLTNFVTPGVNLILVN